MEEPMRPEDQEKGWGVQRELTAMALWDWRRGIGQATCIEWRRSISGEITIEAKTKLLLQN
jgi:hypothetical protein